MTRSLSIRRPALPALIGALALSFGTVQATAGPDLQFSGAVALELTGYADGPLYPGQHDGGAAALILTPRLELSWPGDVTTQLVFAPYLRADAHDDTRSYADLREAKLYFDFGSTNLTLGFDHVFWGKTESGRLVDIINQKDFAAGTGDEDKLGELMLAASHFSDLGWGSLVTSAYYMPRFRERRFGGEASRNRGALAVDMDDPRYLDGTSEHTPSYALRFDLTAGRTDLGLSFFRGVSRDPGFEPNADGSALRPVYGEITQIGLDGQITFDAVLLKFEAIRRQDQINRLGEKEDYDASVIGLEYTFYGLGGSNADLGVLVEYARDSRGDRALTPLENDLVIGARLALNNPADTSALATLALDRDTDEKFLHIEAEHRLTDTLSLSFEANKVIDPARGSLFYDTRNDSSAALTIAYSW